MPYPLKGSRTYDRPVIRSANQILTDPKEAADYLSAHYATQMSDEQFPQDFIQIKNKAEAEERFNFETGNLKSDYNLPFSDWEITIAIGELKKSAPGPDTIHNLMIKNLVRIRNTQLSLTYPEYPARTSIIPIN